MIDLKCTLTERETVRDLKLSFTDIYIYLVHLTLLFSVIICFFTLGNLACLDVFQWCGWKGAGIYLSRMHNIALHPDDQLVTHWTFKNVAVCCVSYRFVFDPSSNHYQIFARTDRKS